MRSLVAQRANVNIGERFGYLRVIGQPFLLRCGMRRHQYVVCECDCGQVCVVRTNGLNTKHTTSCGCRRLAERSWTRHGMSGGSGKKKHPAYQLWRRIKHRCYCASDAYYHRYGGRGIAVCDEWRDSPAAFVSWAMANGWKPGLQLDRIDNDGDYRPSNCRFVTAEQNSRNTSRTVQLTCHGRTQGLSDWADEVGIKAGTIRGRLFRGWSVQKALTTNV